MRSVCTERTEPMRIKRAAVLQTALLLSSSSAAYANAWGVPSGSTNTVAPLHHMATATSLPLAGGATLIHNLNQAMVMPVTGSLLQHTNVSTGHLSALTTLSNHSSVFVPPQTTLGSSGGGFKLGGQGLSLDLTSAATDVVLGANLFRGTHSVTIDVGGVQQSFAAGQRATAGEYLAIKEALGGSAQTIVLSSNGTASAGDFNLSIVGSHTSLLVVPSGVTALDVISSSTNRNFSISGDLLNYGSIDALSSNAAISAGSIRALNITNEAGGVISSTLNSNLGNIVSGNLAPLSLTLAAAQNLTNAGTISSSANLVLSSAGGNFSNSGLVSAANNVNFVNPHSGGDITINGQGGTVQALNGDINVRGAAYNGSGNVTMSGGNYLSRNLNVYSGTGAITGSIGQVSGVLNTDAGATHLVADTTTLYLGKNSALADPTYASTGNVVINGAVTANEAITILAGGNISASGDASVSTSGSGSGSDITMVAGASVTTSGTTAGTTLPSGSPITTGTAVVDFSSGTGGNIDLSGSTHNGAIISTAGNTAGGNAGNVILAALANGSVGGQVLLANGGTSGKSIDASAQLGNGGNITILAGASPAAAATTVNIGGSVQSSGGGTFNSGNILIATVNPTASTGTTVSYDPNGAVSAGSATIVAGTSYAPNAKVQTGDLISAAGGGLATQNGGTGGNVTVEAGAITTGQILTFGGGGGGASLGVGAGIGGVGGAGGVVTLQGDNAGNATTGSIFVNGQINSAGGGGGGSLSNTASGGGQGGAVTVNAAGPVSITGQIYSGDGGAGGTDNGNTATGGGGGGSFGGGGGGAGAGGLLQIVAAASGGGGAGLFGGGGGGTNVLVNAQALGGGGGGIFGFGTGGVGATVDGHIGGINLGGIGVGVGLLNGSSVGGLLAGLAGAAGQITGALGLGGLDVPGLTLNAPSTANADIKITGAGITLGGDLFGRNVILNAAPGSNGAIDLTHNVYGTNSISIASQGTGDISDIGGTLFTPTLTALTQNASIGSAANPVNTSAGMITANAGGAGSNVYINDSGPVALVGANSAGTAGTNGTFSLTAAGSITAGAAETLAADTVNLNSTGVSPATDIGAAAAPLLVTAPTLTANATGNVNIVNDASGTISLGASSAGAASGSFTLEATNADALDTTGDVTGHIVTLTVDQAGAAINVGSIITGTNAGTVTLTADGSILNTTGAGPISGGTLALTSYDGDIGSSGTPLNVASAMIGANAAGNVYLSNAGAVDLQASSAGSGDTFSVVTKADANGNGGITVSGDIAAAAGAPIGTIVLNSSESGKAPAAFKKAPPRRARSLPAPLISPTAPMAWAKEISARRRHRSCSIRIIWPPILRAQSMSPMPIPATSTSMTSPARR